MHSIRLNKNSIISNNNQSYNNNYDMTLDFQETTQQGNPPEQSHRQSFPQQQQHMMNMTQTIPKKLPSTSSRISVNSNPNSNSNHNRAITSNSTTTLPRNQIQQTSNVMTTHSNTLQSPERLDNFQTPEATSPSPQQETHGQILE